MRYLYSIILLLNLVLTQTFDPETGELINESVDSTKTNSFNPETGTHQNLNYNSTINTANKTLSISEITRMARKDVLQYFNGELIVYRYLGGAVSLSTLLPSAFLGMGLGYFLTDDDGGGAIGFWAGGGVSAYGVPRLIAKLDSVKPILLDLPHIQVLSPKQKQIYLDQVSKELQKKRVREIYNGEKYILGFTIGIPILLGIIFG